MVAGGAVEDWRYSYIDLKVTRQRGALGHRAQTKKSVEKDPWQRPGVFLNKSVCGSLVHKIQVELH